MSRLPRLLIAALGAVATAAACTLALGWFWRAIGGGAMGFHGWTALAIGISGTLALAWALMSLAFRSHRDGWDDRVDNSLDPGREGED
jgi:hypothetical protein